MADAAPPLALRKSVPEIADARQLILVTAPAWNSFQATLALFERNASGRWRPVGSVVPCVIGRKGLGWGIGLHGTGRFGEPRKREGDDRAPAGVFALQTVFGAAPASSEKGLNVPYRQMTAESEGVDDPRSRYYNRIVERSAVRKPDWSHAEKMLLPSGCYRLGIVLEHNWKPYPGFGSCIFLHIWLGAGQGTSGCTAMPAKDMERIVRWLDHAKSPVFVQLPESERLRFKEAWDLP